MKQISVNRVSIEPLSFDETYVNATVFTVPICVIFIAWTSFPTAGDDSSTHIRSIRTIFAQLGIVSRNPLALRGIGARILTGAFENGGIGRTLRTQASRLKFPNAPIGLLVGQYHCADTTFESGKDITTANARNPVPVATS